MPEETDGSSEAGQAPETENAVEDLLKQERKKSEELLTRLKYLQADFENYRKRVDKEVQEAEELSVRNLVTRLLAVLDELELAAANSERPNQGKAVSEGIRMVLRNLSAVMKTVGLKRIEAVGARFDPRLHEAVEKTQGTGDADIVAEEVRSGYTFRGQVLRPSMVKVELASKKVAQQEESADE